MAGPRGARGTAKLIQPQPRARAGLERLDKQIEGVRKESGKEWICDMCY